MNYEVLVNGIVDVLVIVGSVLFVAFFFGMCIFVHELGHFLVAKWRGLHVDAFSIGFKKIWSKKINGVEYRIGCLPRGGYVELPQVDSATETPKAADGTELPKAKPIDRLLTAAAGPICNIIFGLILGCIVWAVGIPQDTPKMRAIEVAQIEEDSPEYRAGLRKGDRIVKLNGENFHLAWKDFVVEILTNIGEVTLDVERDEIVNGKKVTKRFTVKYKPEVNEKKMAVEKTAYPFFEPRIPIELHPDKNSPAANAGIKTGDQLLSINGMLCEHAGHAQYMINYYGDQPLTLEMRRAADGEVYTVEVMPVKLPDELDFYTDYYTGVLLSPQMEVKGLYKNFPAFASGLLPGDKLLKYNGQQIKSFEHFKELIRAGKEQEFDLTVDRNGVEVTVKTRAKAVPPRSIGVEFMLRDHPNPLQQFGNLIELTAKSIRSMVVRLGYNLGVTRQQSNLSARNMSGPMGMAVVLYRSVQLSPALGIYFVVMISFALAIFNLLPLPVLDGGHCFMALIEMIFRRPIPVIVVKVLSYAFIGLLLLLMLYVTYMDVMRVIPQNGAPQQEQKTEQSAKVPENKNSTGVQAPAAQVPENKAPAAEKPAVQEAAPAAKK